MTIENLIRSLYSAGVERAKARYVVADALAYDLNDIIASFDANGAQLLREADSEMDAVITCKWA